MKRLRHMSDVPVSQIAFEEKMSRVQTIVDGQIKEVEQRLDKRVTRLEQQFDVLASQINNLALQGRDILGITKATDERLKIQNDFFEHYIQAHDKIHEKHDEVHAKLSTAIEGIQSSLTKVIIYLGIGIAAIQFVLPYVLPWLKTI
jgi:hypothetical protein